MYYAVETASSIFALNPGDASSTPILPNTSWDSSHISVHCQMSPAGQTVPAVSCCLIPVLSTEPSVSELHGRSNQAALELMSGRATDTLQPTPRSPGHGARWWGLMSPGEPEAPSQLSLPA